MWQIFYHRNIITPKSDSSLLGFFCFIKISGLFYIELIFFPDSFGGQTRTGLGINAAGKNLRSDR
jgi:hypothetical protein